MGETTNQIESHIQNKRDDLGMNLQELEQKVKSATDWREQFRKNPMTMVAVAFGGGVFLASMMGGRKTTYSSKRLPSDSDAPHAATDRQTHKALETWDNIKGALVGIAATRFKDFVADVIPGFHEQLQGTEQARRSSNVPSPSAPQASS